LSNCCIVPSLFLYYLFVFRTSCTKKDNNNNNNNNDKSGHSSRLTTIYTFKYSLIKRTIIPYDLVNLKTNTLKKGIDFEACWL